MSNTYSAAEAAQAVVREVFAGRANFEMRQRPAQGTRRAIEVASYDMSYMYGNTDARLYSDAAIEAAAATWLRGWEASRPVPVAA